MAKAPTEAGNGLDKNRKGCFPVPGKNTLFVRTLELSAKQQIADRKGAAIGPKSGAFSQSAQKYSAAI